MIMLAILWNFIKSRQSWIKRTIEGGLVAGLVYVFFVGL
jgi:hypothetical protein